MRRWPCEVNGPSELAIGVRGRVLGVLGCGGWSGERAGESRARRAVRSRVAAGAGPCPGPWAADGPQPARGGGAGACVSELRLRGDETPRGEGRGGGSRDGDPPPARRGAAAGPAGDHTRHTREKNMIQRHEICGIFICAHTQRSLSLRVLYVSERARRYNIAWRRRLVGVSRGASRCRGRVSSAASNTTEGAGRPYHLDSRERLRFLAPSAGRCLSQSTCRSTSARRADRTRVSEWR